MNAPADKKAEASLGQGFRILGDVFIFLGAVVITVVKSWACGTALKNELEIYNFLPGCHVATESCQKCLCSVFKA